VALTNNDPGGLDFPFEGEVLSVAVPSWLRPAFAIPVVSFGSGSNTRYVQVIDAHDRIVGFSPFDAPSASLAPADTPANGVQLDGPALHAVVGLAGEIHVGTRIDLTATVSGWVPEIPWPVTRLAFADFVGDERAIVAAADAALKDKATRSSKREASIWFANAVVFPRIQRGALQAATTVAGRAKLEAALDEMSIEVSTTDIVAHLPPLLADLFDGANVRAAPALAMASKLAMLVSPGGLSLTSIEPTETSRRRRVYSQRRRKEANRPDKNPASSPSKSRGPHPASFGPAASAGLRQAAAEKMSAKLGLTLKRRRGSLYEADDGDLRVVISTSRRYNRSYQSYWYCFYDVQREYLLGQPSNYLLLGAIDTGRVWAVPATEVERMAPLMNRTKRANGQTYSHILSKLVGTRCVITAGGKEFDISPYEI